ncbi:hypothetical protein JW968_03110 [Candidatus Woesearchaeota archaeon]|nr:hypothetical protein [Candidatus Woesearchaeota archaeon]
MKTFDMISEGSRIFLKSQARKIMGFEKHAGDHKEICKSIIKRCWNGKYFLTSSGHFNEFYVRDFTFCMPHLLELGHKNEVKQTLSYALSRFSEHHKLTTTINPRGRPVSVFSYSAESLPFLLMCLRKSKSKELSERYHDFLQAQTYFYHEFAFDEKTGLLTKNINFSSIKDNSRRRSSCYDNCMLALLNEELKRTRLDNPFKNHNITKTVKEKFWNGDYFLDTTNTNHVAGDANTFPYWTGLFDSAAMMKKSIKAIQENHLDDPFPLKYTHKPLKGEIRWPMSMLLPDYEADTLWTHLGLCYISVVSKVDKKLAKEYLSRYKENIEKHKNFLEVYWPNGKPFRTLLYYCDHNMLWASMYLGMANRMRLN